MYNDSSFAEGYAIGRDSNNNGYNNGMFGGDWAWWIVILLIFGWGNGGFGGFGGNGGGFMNGALTRGDLCQDMNFSDLESSVRGVQQGLCDGFYAMNTGMLNGFSGIQQTLCQGFNGVNTSILTSANGTERAIDGLSHQLSDCCCATQRAIDGVNYNMAKNTCDIIQAGNANTQRVIDFLTSDKIAALQAENSLLTNQLSQNAQTNTIINTLRPVAQPAYITCSPFESAYGYGFNRSGCGCNSCGC